MQAFFNRLALLTTAQDALLASERSLRRPKEARVVNGMTFTIGQEGRESDVNTNVRMRTLRGQVFRLRNRLTDNEGVPVSISSQIKMNRLRRPFNRTMQLDFEGLAQLLRDKEL